MENKALDCSELDKEHGLLEALLKANSGAVTFYGSLGTGRGFGNQPFREFKIYGEIGENPDTVNFRKFMKEIEERINADPEIIERSKKCNVEFAECLRGLLADSKNDICIGAMVARIQIGCKRYSYIKNLNFNGREYEAEINELERIFRLIEV